jgi:hypothetical protein
MPCVHKAVDFNHEVKQHNYVSKDRADTPKHGLEASLFVKSQLDRHCIVIILLKPVINFLFSCVKNLPPMVVLIVLLILTIVRHLIAKLTAIQ